MKYLYTLIALLSIVVCQAQNNDPLLSNNQAKQEAWVESTLKSMSLNQKIGQLFMVRGFSNKDKKHTNAIKRLIRRYHIGGLAFFQGTPEKQVSLTNLYQKTSKIPILIGIDAEWGLNMRLDKTFLYPMNMTLGAIQDNKLIERFGKQVGIHSKRIGVHVNFAPDVDINTNPKNPVIGIRSFGENKYNVTEKAIAFTKGMNSAGVIGTAKHFPGHGDTSTDSHKTLPFLDFDRSRLDAIELYPYAELFKNNMGGVMVAHLDVPALEAKKGVPTSLSYNVITKLLKEELGFKGLIMTDALNMKGAANYAQTGDIDLAAFQAGNDMLLLSEDVKIAVKKIKKAIANKTISMDRLNESVRKILKAKYLVGLHNFEPIKTGGISEDINTIEDELLNRELYENAITLLKNEQSIFPIKDLSTAKIAYVKLGDSENDTFIETLKKYTTIDVISGNSLEVILQQLKSYNRVIVGHHKSNETPRRTFKFSEKELEWLAAIAEENKVILDVFASAYALNDIRDFSNIEGLLLSYQNHKVSQELSAQMIFGAIGTKGKLPVSIKNEFSEGSGIETSDLKRLRYSIPEAVDMDRILLKKIDSMTKMAVDSIIAPGGQVLVARFGKVIYHKSFGYHTYDKKQAVKITDLYDLASVTKILGGLPMVMKSEEQRLFNLETTLGEMMPFLKGSNKDTVTIKEALSHVGKIKAWIPYYLETVDSISKKPFDDLYAKKKSKDFSIEISDDLYLANHYTDTIYKRIFDVPQRTSEGYKYSGLIFYLFKKYIKDTYGKEMDVMNAEQFYTPLGANSLMYNPRKKFKKEQIAPTELDDYYRHQLLQGHVHDMGAAMMNGVSGNAGLFSNSNDVAKMMQMYLQRGYYGGKRYLKEKTLHKFNKRYYAQDSIRRGLGFDKPSLDSEVQASSKYASANSFGHSGFTGTFAWVDPDTGILYVFLSNRVHPTMTNNKIGESNLRTNIHNLIYEAIIE